MRLRALSWEYIPPVERRQSSVNHLKRSKTMPDWTYFTEDELRCKCGCGRCEMDDEAVGVFDFLREQATERWQRYLDGQEFEDLPFIGTSGFRCAKHNAAVGSKNHLHPKGRAIDIAVTDPSKRAIILTEALAHPKIMGVGISGIFLHLDTVPRRVRRVWTY